MSDIDRLLAATEISGNVSIVGANPLEPATTGDVHYLATLRRAERALDVYCSAAPDQPAPTVAQALLAAGRRANAIERAGSRRAWAQTLGLDPDAADAELRYTAHRSEAKALRAFLGDDRFAELVRWANDQAQAHGGDHAGAAERRDGDPVAFPARSDEMTFQEPELLAAGERDWTPGARTRSMGALVAAGALTGAALGMLLGRVIPRLPVVGGVLAGGALGVATAAGAVRRIQRRRAADDVLATLADQRAAIETGSV